MKKRSITLCVFISIFFLVLFTWAMFITSEKNGAEEDLNSKTKIVHKKKPTSNNLLSISQLEKNNIIKTVKDMLQCLKKNNYDSFFNDFIKPASSKKLYHSEKNIYLDQLRKNKHALINDLEKILESSIELHSNKAKVNVNGKAIFFVKINNKWYIQL